MTQFENLSDDDLMNLESIPDIPAKEPTAEQETPTEEETPVVEQEEEVVDEPEGEADAGGAAGDDEEGEKPEGSDHLKDDELGDAPPVKPVAKAPAKTEEEKVVTPAANAQEEAAIDYKAEFEKLVGTPIKANGKDLVLKDTAEVLRLVQQGAGYASKMEQLKPARKSAAMLEAVGLLGNEAALAQMIDLYNGKPEAIARMAKDLNIDLLSIDMDTADKYTPAGHLQTDEAVNFADTLKEVRTLEGGKEALALIDTMDDKSKNMLWGNALAIRQLYDYKQSGVYDTVAAEVDRRRTLGQIPADMPFIVAFQQAGEDIAKAAEAAMPSTAPEQTRTPVTPEPAKPAVRTPIATGVAPRKQPIPDARAAAAAAPRSGAGAAKQIPDIYSLSDADIEKMSAPPI